MLGAFAVFCGLMLLAGWAIQIRDWIASARWSQVPGVVRGSVVEPVTQNDPYRPWIAQSGFRAVVRYAYMVDEQTYLGSRYSATREPFFATQTQAEAFLERFPQGRQIPVKVNPDDPKASLLLRQLSVADALPGYMALGCLMIGILMI